MDRFVFFILFLHFCMVSWITCVVGAGWPCCILGFSGSGVQHLQSLPLPSWVSYLMCDSILGMFPMVELSYLIILVSIEQKHSF